MEGSELSRRFYGDLVRPWLDAVAPGLKHSAALIGYGSELLGFDDETSRDHNFGPRVQIVLARQDFDQHAKTLVALFTSVAPSHVRGEPIGWRSRPHPPSSGTDAAGAIEHGLEFHTLEGLLEAHFAVRSLEGLSNLDWLGLAEQKLLGFTAGPLLHDDGDRLGRARTQLEYFPKDVWLYKIACQWRRIAEEQAFVGRAGQVGDDLGSRLIASRLVHQAMGMGFLFERRYAPYAKWFGSGFARLSIAAVLTPLLQQALIADSWTDRGSALAAAYLALAEWQNGLDVVKKFKPVIGPYHDRPFTTINADEAISATHAAIGDPAIRRLSIVGALDQVTDLTGVLTEAGLARRMMGGLLG